MLGPEWAYHITIHQEDWQTVEGWCECNFGEFGDRWYKLGIDIADWLNTGSYRTTWYFKNEADVILFKLRWA